MIEIPERKRKLIPFSQTPMDKMRIHWGSGTHTYGSAQDTVRELRKRGYTVEIPACSAKDPNREMEKLLQAPMRQRVGKVALKTLHAV